MGEYFDGGRLVAERMSLTLGGRFLKEGEGTEGCGGAVVMGWEYWVTCTGKGANGFT